MEGKSDPGGPSVLKVLEPLKRHLFDFQSSPASPSKPLTNREVCSSLSDLTNTVSSSAHRPNSVALVSQTVELLVHACSSQEHDVRLAAAENLRRLIKAVMNTHLSRLQQDLFHELKKNGSWRSLVVSLDCFAALFPLTRPSKCTAYAISLLPVLVRITGRAEEGVLECLGGALGSILPTMVPCLTTAKLQSLMTAVMERLPGAVPAYRRMAASTLHTITTHCRHPSTQAHWAISKLLVMGCGSKAGLELVQGVLLTLQQLFSSCKELQPPLEVLRQSYAFVVSCLVHREPSTAISAMEALHQLLLAAPPQLATWLTTPLPQLTTPLSQQQSPTDFWSGAPEGGGGDTVSVHSQMSLETPLDSYFDSEQELAPSFTGPAKATTGLSQAMASASPAANEPETTPNATPPAALLESSCLAVDGPPEPLVNLVKFLLESVLLESRVSAQSVALACVAAATDLHPPVLPSLEPVAPFLGASDPKLRSRATKLLAVVVLSHLRRCHGDFSQCGPLPAAACEQLYSMLGDPTPTVLKAACEALQLCLPAIISSTQPQRAVRLLCLLLPLQHGSYWLTKVELLATLSCLDYTRLALLRADLPAKVLWDCVFPLLGDGDHRVRTAACEALESLAAQLQLNRNSLLGHAHSQAMRAFCHLHNVTVQLSLAGIGDSGPKATPPSPMCLDHILWALQDNLSSSLDMALQRGALEALHHLSLSYPPPTVPSVWSCDQTPCTTLTLAQALLTSSRLAWGIQGHLELLELASTLFLACALAHMQSSARSGEPWCALGQPSLGSHASALLRHSTQLLAIFAHILDGREPDSKENRRLSVPGIPRRPTPDPTSPVRASPKASPGKPKTPLLESLQRPPLVPRDGIGQFAHVPHLLKVMDACKAAYTNYQVSLAPVGQDKFSQLLQVTHNTLAAMLEVALAEDVRSHVEELMGYLVITVRADTPGALLCVQQLLNALFGMNVAAQHTHLFSPYISSLPYDIVMPFRVTPSTSLLHCTLLQPLSLMTAWLQAPPPSTLLTPPNQPEEVKKRVWRKSLIMKPVNSVSSIKDYIGFFEPLVIMAVKQFPYTSSSLLQQRVLFLIVQLLQLKVRYELLDCSHAFLEAVIKLVSLMESGTVRGGERLVPHLFQFLVLLASDSSKLVTVPEVMQKCDGVMASGRNVTSFAIPALQPLVLTLFVRPSRESPDLETQREVVLNMLLRLVSHHRIITLLCYVLECYSHRRQQWQQVSSQIFAALLPHMGRLQVFLESREALLALYQLLTAMDPSAISIQALFTALLKPAALESVKELISWLGVLCTSLGVMVTIFPEATTLQQISSLHFAVPSLCSPLASVPQQPCEDREGEGHTAQHLARFLRGALYLAVSALAQLEVQRSYEDFQLVPVLATNILLLWQTLMQGPYPSLGPACASLPPHPHLTQALLSLASSHPLLTLHYLNLTLNTSSPDITLVTTLLQPPATPHPSPSLSLLHHCTLLLACDNAHPEVTVHATAIPTILDHTQDPSVKKLFQAAVKDEVLLQSLLQLLMSSDLTSPTHCLQVLQVCRQLHSAHTLPLLSQHLIPHPLSAVATTAATVAMEIVTALGSELSAEMAAQLIEELEPHSNRCGQLLLQLRELVGKVPAQKPTPVFSDPLAAGSGSVVAHSVTEPWLVERVGVFCHTLDANPEECVHVLGCLGESARSIIEASDFNQALLECCLVRGLQLSKARDPTHSPSHLDSLEMEFTTTGQQSSRLHPLMQASVNRLKQGLKADPTDSALTRPLLWLLIAQQQLSNEIPLEQETAVAIATLTLHSLKDVCSKDDSLALHSAMDCCALALQSPEVCQTISEGWACEAVQCLCDIVQRAYEGADLQWVEQGEEKGALEKAQHQLQSILTVLLPPRPPPSSSSFYLSINALTMSLCRVPSLHPCTLLPPALFRVGGGVSDRMLDQALMESEILQQYMQRINSIGWLNRPQFEERWMQLLGVVNQAPPPEGTPTEEYNAYVLNVSAGVQAVTSLLLGATLRPTPGNPTHCPPMHTHHNGDVLFLGSRPGRKLARLRRVLELQLLLQCGARSSLLNHYQSPSLQQIISPHYPPIYTRNIERGLGEVGLGVGQMSIQSLWPVMLRSATHSGRPTSPDTGDVDIRSSILSLIDLYSHWLSLPVHTILLHHMLRSVLMLSDLFALSGQYEWMLGFLLRLHEAHPSEDIATCPFIVLGMLKAAAVLKLVGGEAERVAKVVEKCLAPDAPISVQDACVRGLLYLSEDIGSQVLPLLGPALTKYLPSHLQLCSRFTEAHVMAVWSLAVSLSVHHSHHLRDPSFTSRLLDHALPLLPHPHISTRLFHSLTLGLEHLVIHFCLSPSERVRLASTAASHFVKSDQSKSLAALALLLTCMYTGEEADPLSGLADMEMVTMDTAVQAREQINSMMERLRHGPLRNVAFLVRLLPQLTVDFLSPIEALQTVVSEFVSPHQPRPQLAARVMAETFALLLQQKQEATVTEWVVLSLESFVQQEPEHKAVWSITCLLSAASTSSLFRSLFMLVVYQPQLPQHEALSLLCTAAKVFYSKQCIQQQQEPFLEKFQSSHYPLLKQVVHYCLHS